MHSIPIEELTPALLQKFLLEGNRVYHYTWNFIEPEQVYIFNGEIWVSTPHASYTVPTAEVALSALRRSVPEHTPMYIAKTLPK